LNPTVGAFRSSDIDLVRQLVEIGSKWKSGHGMMNLLRHEATRNGREDMLCLVLEENGIDVNPCRNVDMRTMSLPVAVGNPITTKYQKRHGRAQES
jgi:hypothetical protein